MTIGLAAVAGRRRVQGRGTGREAIVLMSDREYDWGDGLKAVSPIRKLRGLLQRTGKDRAGWFTLYTADDTAQTHRVVDLFRELARDGLERDVLKGKVPTARAVYLLAERSYAAARKEWRAAQRHLPRSDRDEFAPGHLICGYDEERVPAIYSLDKDGVARSQHESGYSAVGIAENVARERLQWLDLQPTDPLPKVLYACYHAKRRAEGFVGVSRPFYAWILVLGREQPIRVPPPILGQMRVIYDALHRFTRPFPSTQRRAPSPADWRQLEARVTRWFGGGQPGRPRGASFPIAPARPSSRSRSGGRR